MGRCSPEEDKNSPASSGEAFDGVEKWGEPEMRSGNIWLGVATGGHRGIATEISEDGGSRVARG